MIVEKSSSFVTFPISLILYPVFFLFSSIFFLNGCEAIFLEEKKSSKEVENERFTSFTEKLFCKEVAASQISLHYTLKEPEAYGIDKADTAYGTIQTDSTQIKTAAENIQQALYTFSYEKLNVKNKITYDLLKQYLRSLREEADYLYYEEPLNTVNGVQTQIPIVLSEYQFYDRDKVSTQEEKQEIALKAFTSDYFLGSVNAMSEDGVFINIDGNANRVAAYAYGPKHVLLIVGMNKVVKTEADAMSRARNEAAPINAQRFGIDTPCSKNGTCFDCKSPQCICCQILTTRFSRVKGRFQIILVDENLGF